MNFQTRAEFLIIRGIPVAPVRPRSKVAMLNNWEELATTDPQQLFSFRYDVDSNTAAIARLKVGAVCFFEVDKENFHLEIERQTGQKFPETLLVSSTPGKGRGNFYLKHTLKSVAFGNAQGKDENGKEAWSFRADRRYVVGPLSVKEDGTTVYTVMKDAPIADVPDWLVDWMTANKQSAVQTDQDDETPIIEGSRNSTLASLLGKARQNLKLSKEELYALGCSINSRRCQPPLPETEVHTIAYSVGGYAIAPPPHPVILNGKPAGQAAPASVTSPEPSDAQRAERAAKWLEENDKPKLYKHYAMTEFEYEFEAAEEYPVYPFLPQPGPVWSESILYGPTGDFVRKASEYNESHPAGILLDFLTSIGNMIGRGPYFNINGTRHGCNEFFARVGPSSKGRKGTGRDAVDAVTRKIDDKWFSNCVMGGFGSGESIINNIRDAVTEKRTNPRTGETTEIKIPGVDDKRLCIREGELSKVFVLAGKLESQAGMIIRDAWDGKPLRNTVKGKNADGFSNSAKCSEPHISISGDTTVSELKEKMHAGASEDGFGNRFLYCYVYPVKHCPQGGPEIDWTGEIIQFFEIIQYAKNVKLVSMSGQARKWWNRNYSDIENNGPTGLAGKMTARAAAHIRRLAMLYALIDKTDVVELKHLHAAYALWKYCEESAIYIFSGVTKEQKRIAQWIEQRGRATFNQVRDDLYHRNKPVAEIRADLDSLVRVNQLLEKGGIYALGSQLSSVMQ
jgi:hypothetical protein